MIRTQALAILNMEDQDFNRDICTEISNMISDRVKRRQSQITFDKFSKSHKYHSIIPAVKKWYFFDCTPYENILPTESNKHLLTKIQLFIFNKLIQWGYDPQIICFCGDDYCGPRDEICIRIKIV